eukprot:snap_masked-scaffold_15-processed-gene-6.8-mRNA-1 protein AED:1.00 eAED:1.00 QI:0/-1/0/0/-1/1/1/0/411
MELSQKVELPSRLIDAKNYATWAKKMKLHFSRTATWGIVTGTRTVPDPKEFEKFERQAAGAFSDLVRCVGGDLEDLCLMFESFQEAWKELQLVCATSEDVKLQEAERELEQLEAGPDVLLTVTKFKVAVKKLKQAGGSVSNSQQALKLFSLLPAEFNELMLNIRTEKMFRSDDNSYDMEKTLVKVMQRATVLSSLRDTRAVLKAHVTSAAPAKQSIKKKKCPICNKEGHLKFRCPCCWNCKKTGHKSFDCPNKKKEQVKKVCSTKETVDLSGLGLYEKREICLIGAHGGTQKSNEIHFCLDSGASLHVCSRQELLTNLRRLKEPLVVETLSGFVLVNYIGDFVGLTETGLSVRLTNVTFDENLNQNMIVSTGLLADKDWSTKFVKDRAEIVDETKTHKLVAKRGQNELYWL